MTDAPDLRTRLEQESHVVSAKLAALELVTDLGLTDEAGSEVVESIAVRAVAPQEEINQSCERLLGLARVLGWHVQGFPPALPFDSHIGGTVLFDSRVDDSAYQKPKGGNIDIGKALSAETKKKLADARVSHVIRFAGKLFDNIYGFDTPSLVTRSSSDHDFEREELRHLDFGSVVKASIIPLSIMAIAERSRISRPTISNIQNDFVKDIKEKMVPEQAADMLEEVLAVDEPVRVIFRPVSASSKRTSTGRPRKT